MLPSQVQVDTVGNNITNNYAVGTIKEMDGESIFDMVRCAHSSECHAQAVCAAEVAGLTPHACVAVAAACAVYLGLSNPTAAFVNLVRH